MNQITQLHTTMKNQVTYCYNSLSRQTQETESFETEAEAQAWLDGEMSKDSEMCGLLHTSEESPSTEEILRACDVSEERMEALGVL